jgi:CHAD domain-containing protein
VPYHLKQGESVPDEVRRIVREELQSAAQQLSGHEPGKRDEAIHEARKSVKKIRAILRLVRPDLGELYPIENARLRDLGQKLSEFRDAAAILETFDELREKFREELGTVTLRPVRTRLVKEKNEHAQAADIEQVLARCAASLRGTGRRLRTWPVIHDGFNAIAPGFEKIFRRGRKAMAAARKSDSDVDFHEWRKAVKYHWYHIRLLERSWTDVLQAYEKSLKDLETWLGDDHNLVVLRDRIKANPAAYGSPRTTATALDLIARYQKELRAKALSLGERVYLDKPVHFRHHMHGVWDAWRSQPKSMKKAS